MIVLPAMVTAFVGISFLLELLDSGMSCPPSHHEPPVSRGVVANATRDVVVQCRKAEEEEEDEDDHPRDISGSFELRIYAYPGEYHRERCRSPSNDWMWSPSGFSLFCLNPLYEDGEDGEEKEEEEKREKNDRV